MSGLSRTPGKRVWDNIPPRVRIPPSPPNTPQIGASSAKQPAKFQGFAGFLLLFVPKLAYWQLEKWGVC